MLRRARRKRVFARPTVTRSAAGSNFVAPAVVAAGTTQGRLCPPYGYYGYALLPAPALWRPIVVLAAAAAETGLGVPAREKAEAVVARDAVARHDLGRRLARDEAALGLVAQHRDELGAVIGLGAQRLVRDDDRGSRHRGRRDAIEHILRDGDAVERVLGIVPVVDRDRGPAQAGGVARHRREHMRADRLVGIADRYRSLNGRIEHLAPVRPRLMRVAPHVKLLRRAADVNRDRLEPRV